MRVFLLKLFLPKLLSFLSIVGLATMLLMGLHNINQTDLIIHPTTIVTGYIFIVAVIGTIILWLFSLCARKQKDK